jgi:peptidoglycan-associated lipoprotein
MQHRQSTPVTLGLVLAAALVASCSPKPKPAAAPEATPAPAAEPRPVATPAPAEQTPPSVAPAPRIEELPSSLEELNRRGYLKDVFFDLDRYDLRPLEREGLVQDAAWLKRWSSVRLTVEGHCDERGTAAYNMALGERRAQAVRDYLVGLGVEAGRITVISYGKEKPFAAGHDEQAWEQNRRGHLVVTAR